MRILVQIRGECLAVPCRPEMTIDALGQEALRKYKKLKLTKEDAEDPAMNLQITEMHKTIGGAMMDPDDRIGDILSDGEFAKIVLSTDPTVVGNGRSSQTYSTGPPWHVLPGIDPIATGQNFQRRGTHTLALDGNSLSIDDLYLCGQGYYKLKLTHESERRIIQSRELLERIVRENKVVYGITTGFGNFAKVTIPAAKLLELQENLIRSHAVGIGAPLCPSRGLMVFALRINVLAKGYSGISLHILNQLVDAFNGLTDYEAYMANSLKDGILLTEPSCISWIPEKGTVGCSGDLAQLAHLALGLMGEGKMWSPETGWDDALKVLRMHNLEPLKLGPKEGIALINGTQMVTALGAEALHRADAVARQADVIAAMTIDVLKGTTTAFDSAIQELRPHPGQINVARRLRALLHSESNPSEIAESHRFCGKVQDAYTLRCVPQVHGIVHDTISFVHKIISTELNSATDNPLVFGNRNEILSGGNFHGEYPAKALDYLAIAVHELAQISERRIERLVNPDLSGLPAFLTSEPGINSGFMMIQTSAASLVSENKVLCHPSSVDSIPTSANQEDHVSMGGFASRKALRIIEHVEYVLAMELLAACQGMEFLKPLQTTAPLQEIYKLVRQVSPAIERDRYLGDQIQAVVSLIQEERIWATVQPHLIGFYSRNDFNTIAESPTASIASPILSPRSLKRSRHPSNIDDEFAADMSQDSPATPTTPTKAMKRSKNGTPTFANQ